MTKRFAKALASFAIVGTVALGAWSFAPTETVAGGETRTISMYHIHTKESITVTYMKDGRYVPSAIKKLNYFLRDWRRNEVITIDPRTIDLVWELHADLGSKAPINVVSGYRSPATNAFLKRIGRNVAKKSQHMKGRAIDFFFPDVKTVNIRNSALPRKVGGVGYYRSSGGPTGFLHVDSGNVRHWGPAISNSQMASIMREGPKTVGARFKGGKRPTSDMIAVADAGSAPSGGKKKSSLVGWLTGGNVQVVDEPVDQLENAYALDGQLAAMTQDASRTAKKGNLDEGVSQVYDDEGDDDAGTGDADAGGLANMAQTAAVEELATQKPGTKSNGIIKPRLKPKMVMQLAEAGLADNVNIEPASAPPESQVFKKGPSPVADTLAALEENEPMNPLYDGSENPEEPVSNMEGKTNFAATIHDEGIEEIPLSGPVMASLDGGTSNVAKTPGWLASLFMSNEEMLRGQQVLDVNMPGVMPAQAILGMEDGSGVITTEGQQVSTEGKGDSQIVNRNGKGNLDATALRLPAPTDLSQLN
ncbi:MAG: DUF882 domain-containing protein [Proteobacteria bacterium]|nr:DUF882 domain-containing protein [Pseudomonadota bacterium]